MSTTAPARPQPGAVRSKSQQQRRNRYVIAPLILLVVNVVLFLVFFVWPGALGLLYSFTDYRGVGKLNFVGLANFQKLFADSTFYAALGRTFVYTVLSVPLVYVCSLGVAALLVSKAVRGRTAAKIVIFLPWLISPIVVGVIWKWLFGQDFGFVNFIISTLGGAPVPWSSNGNLALAVVIFASAWGGTAFNMLLFVAALKNIPEALLEAAELDGANAWQRFLNVTLPGIAPTSFMVILLSTIHAMKEFAMIQALTNGGPGTENTLIVQYIYKTGFEQSKVGYASAASMVLMVVLLAIALIQLRFNRKKA
ncbi:carbohydrate ABC transporter permease [Pseudarthrobacter sp. NamE5]|uniref:carbohydrate ABC transporter permease n=1 Tax=Pseudarthrobacter sp. NamE5 TaxID=2576839 RepID=UPI00110B6E97|nr:sugar ABC transporter permease [Pseudarthrobacter sp. NamE5]TLM84635.1 sugar ABC transporter permease [Pseudarthrobacter sp. NamE5]